MTRSKRTVPERRRRGWAAVMWAVLGSAGACGCGSDWTACEETVTCAPDPLPPGAPCQGDTTFFSPASDASGVFVSATLGDDASPGTPDRPVQTFEQALQLAQGRRIYACAETFERHEVLSIATDGTIWGGWDCHDGWRDVHSSRTKRTTLRVLPDLSGLPTLPLSATTLGVDVTARVTLADVDIVASAATLPGGSSIAVLATGGADVEICRSALVAGDGADGAVGAHADGGAGREGDHGRAGTIACLKDATSGGAEMITACDDGESIGGAGGDGFAIGGGDGYLGLPAPSSNPYGYGLGGGGERTMPACLNGNDGLPGEDGTDGIGAQGPGTLTPAGWVGLPGTHGGPSTRGQGGGGGGASRGGATWCGTGPGGGASGGSGGAGGCAGKRGEGGGPGGASLGVVAVDATVHLLHGVSIATGRGGQGGYGGRGQLGGMGGPGGIGGGSVNGSRPGCAGGWGGKGGNGGHGGGGLGGPSIGIASLGERVKAPFGVVFDVGPAGGGGLGGGDDPNAGRGHDGQRSETAQF